MNSKLIAVELYQIVPGASGGLVYWLEGLLRDVAQKDPSIQWFLFCREPSKDFWADAPGQVKRLILRDQTYFARLDEVCQLEQVDLLVRSFPLDVSLQFPADRQISLLPDLQHEQFPEFFSAAELFQRQKNFQSACQSGALLVPSQFTKAALLQSSFGQSCKIVVCPPSLQFADSALGRGVGGAPRGGSHTTPPLAPSEPGPDYFLYPANLWPHKNHRRVLQAFALFRERSGSSCELWLTGASLGRWDELAREFSHLPIRHLGCLSKPRLQQVLAGARALLYFSLYEGFGIPLLEAFQLGVPVGCSRLPPLLEVAQAAALHCDPHDCDQIAEVMLCLDRDAALREKLVALGYQRLPAYNGDQSSSHFLALCHELGQPFATPEPAGLLLRMPGGSSELDFLRFLRRAEPGLRVRAVRFNPQSGLPRRLAGRRIFFLVRRPDRALQRLDRHRLFSRGPFRTLSPDLAAISNPQARMLLGNDLTDGEQRLRQLLEREDVFFGLAGQAALTEQLFCALQGAPLELASRPVAGSEDSHSWPEKEFEDEHPLDCFLFRLASQLFQQRCARLITTRAGDDFPWFRRFEVSRGVPALGCHEVERDKVWTGKWPLSALPVYGPFPAGSRVRVQLKLFGIIPEARDSVEVKLAGRSLGNGRFEYQESLLVWSGELELREGLPATSLPVSLTIRSRCKPQWPDHRSLGMALQSVSVACG